MNMNISLSLIVILITQKFSIFNDTPWQLGFQDSAAPSFSLHDTIVFYLIIISLAVFWVFSIFLYVSYIKLYKTKNNNNSIINYLLVLSCKLYNSTQQNFIYLIAICFILGTVLYYLFFNEYFIVILPKITMDNLIKIIIENTSQISNLNSFWSEYSPTDLSFLRWIQIIFFFIYIVLNIWLIYIEYLDKKTQNKDNSKYLQSGSGNPQILPHVRRYSSYILAGIAALSSIITVKNEYITKTKTQKALEDYQNYLDKATEEIKNNEDQKTAQQMLSRLHQYSSVSSFNTVNLIRGKRSEIKTKISEAKKKFEDENPGSKFWEAKPGNKYLDEIKAAEREDQRLELEENRAFKDLQLTLENGKKYAEEVSKESDEKKILDKINEEINKASFFDLEKLIKELWNTFDTFDAISKVAFVMVLTNSLIIWCLLSIILNKYGDYLMDRFNLEERFPKLGLLIRYRRKLTKYYLLSNYLLIILVCITNILLGISILILFFLYQW